jgi:hypothetical protein
MFKSGKCTIGLEAPKEKCYSVMKKPSLELAKKMYLSEDESIKAYALEHYEKEELEELWFPESWEEIGVEEVDYMKSSSGKVKRLRISAFLSDVEYKYAESLDRIIYLLGMRDEYRRVERFTKEGSVHVVTYMSQEGFMFATPFFFRKESTRDAFEKNFKKELESFYKLYE